MKKGFLFILMVLVSSLSVCALVDADFSSPQIVTKPILVQAHQSTSVELYNGGLDVWSDLVLIVGNETIRIPSLIEPLSTLEVDIPLSYDDALKEGTLAISLYYKNELLDAKNLPVVFYWPKDGTSVALDDSDPFKPEIYLLMDDAAFDTDVEGITVEFLVLDDHEQIAYLDMLGSFYLVDNQKYYYGLSVPKGLPAGTFTANVRFFDGNQFLDEEKIEFTVLKGSSLSLGAIMMMIVLILSLVIVYLLVDMVFHKRTLEDTIKALRP